MGGVYGTQIEWKTAQVHRKKPPMNAQKILEEPLIILNFSVGALP